MKPSVLFGSNIENDDLDWINIINYEADILGMDSISLGGTLAFAMELPGKGTGGFWSALRLEEGVLEPIHSINMVSAPERSLA